MRKSLSTLAILLLLTPAVAFSQRNKNYFSSLKSFTLYPASNYPLKGRIPFKQIEVLDSRFDTAKVGYLRRGYRYRKLVTQNNLSNSLTLLLNKQYKNNLSPESELTLLLVIKHLWLKDKDGNGLSMGMPISKSFSESHSIIDVYAKSGNTYIPLFKSDSTILKYAKLSKQGDELVALPFIGCLKKLVSKTSAELLAMKKKVSFDEVVAYNNKRFDYPVSSKHRMVKGIFMSFKDFLHNEPVTAPFSVNLNNQIDEVYWVNDNSKKVVEKFWGFCDGKRIYIKLGNNFFPLYQDGYTYSLWGNPNITYRYWQLWLGSSNSDATLKRSMRNHKNRPLQVNMETGEVY